jgi:hypothetical protein
LSKAKLRKPEIGEDVYIPLCIDCSGGLAKITSLKKGISGGGETVTLVLFEGITTNEFHWDLLLKYQKELKDAYGEQRAKHFINLKNDSGPDLE